MPSIWERLQSLFTGQSGQGEAVDGQDKPHADEDNLLGRKGESHAATYLKSKGYRILARNYSTPVGEIDIVARDKDFLVFVEVKTRVADEPSPQEQINPHKMNQLTKAAKFYLGRYPPPAPPARFDVVSIIWPQGGSPSLKHFEHAFEATF